MPAATQQRGDVTAASATPTPMAAPRLRPARPGDGGAPGGLIGCSVIGSSLVSSAAACGRRPAPDGTGTSPTSGIGPVSSGSAS